MNKWFLTAMILCSVLIFSCGQRHKTPTTDTPTTLGVKEKGLCLITLVNDSRDNMEVRIEPYDSEEPVYQQLLSPGHKVSIQLIKKDYDIYFRKMDFKAGHIGEWSQQDLLLSYKRKCKVKVNIGSAFFNSPYNRGGPMYDNIR